MQTDAEVPSPASFTRAPLRNRLRVELGATLSEVWALVGNLERYPEYSTGLARVDVERDASSKCTGYICHFRPEKAGDEGISHRETVRWYEPNRGYASLAEEPNPFGLSNALTLMTVETSGSGALLSWSQYYDSAYVAMAKAEFQRALSDIAEKLIARFGGRVVEHYVEGGH